MQESLFPETESPEKSVQVISLEDGELTFIERWLSGDASRELFSQLHKSVAWEQSVITIYGRQVAIPRLNAWYGDPDCHYGYSGHQLRLNPWCQPLLHLREALNLEFDLSMNSVLANLYRDGRDGMGWHSDDEPELGKRPVIASISLGGLRHFTLKHRFKDIAPVKLSLTSGSLLIMAGDTQHFWKHSVPKSSILQEPRINLTYRCVVPI